MKRRNKNALFLACAVLFVCGLYFGRPELSGDGVQSVEVTTIEPVVVARDSASIAETYHRVIKVIDGDTIRVERDDGEETVRLIGVDTPETVDPRKPVQCFGKEASAYARTLLDGKEVLLVYDNSQDKYDKYGRLLAYVYLQDGTLLNKRLIEGGYAHEYTYRAPYKFQEEFRAAEKVAKEQGSGLWADGVCGLRNTTLQIETSTTRIDPPLFSVSENIRCDANVYNCANFSTQEEAQSIFIQCGGPANDIHRLDVDSDGTVCESLK